MRVLRFGNEAIVIHGRIFNGYSTTCTIVLKRGCPVIYSHICSLIHPVQQYGPEVHPNSRNICRIEVDFFCECVLKVSEHVHVSTAALLFFR